jgi:hypothetical protein
MNVSVSYGSGQWVESTVVVCEVVTTRSGVGAGQVLIASRVIRLVTSVHHPAPPAPHRPRPDRTNRQ